MAGAVITGYGIVGPKFSNADEFSDVLVKKKVVMDLYTTGESTVYAGLAEYDFKQKSKSLLPRGERLPKAARMLLHAADEALAMSGFPVGDYRVGVVAGSSGGAISDIIKNAEGSVPSTILTIGNMNSYSLVSSLCAAFGINGVSFGINNSCTSGLDAVVLGNMMIESGHVDMCIVGGTDSTLDPVVLGGFRKMKLLSDKKGDNGPPAPFSGTNSFAISEGAGVIILERRDLAEKREAEIRGEIGLSYISQDGLSPYKSDPGGWMMRKAVDHCITGGLPSYINSQALGLTQQDTVESDIYKERFAGSSIPITSIKGMTGHSMGASGLFQLISGLISLEKQFIPPTIGYNRKYFPDLPVVEEVLGHTVERVLITSQGYGGANSCMMIAKGER
ncbi:beta-ketoacyl synthase N-terminal-like domain-containing protein [Lysinibacillus sphaericus]